MWYFAPYTQRALSFDFEPVLQEIDKNEEKCHKKYVQDLPPEEQTNYGRKVCLHWMRTLCNKGDHCKYLHEWDRDRMPLCQFWERFGRCSNIDCPYKHDPVSQGSKACKFFVRGFCRHGSGCRRRHQLKDSICLNYLAGFCPEGPRCIFDHAIWTEDEN